MTTDDDNRQAKDAVRLLKELRARLGEWFADDDDVTIERTNRGRVALHHRGHVYFRHPVSGEPVIARERGNGCDFAVVQHDGSLRWFSLPLPGAAELS